jgi:hypothetical protein
LGFFFLPSRLRKELCLILLFSLYYTKKTKNSQ